MISCASEVDAAARFSSIWQSDHDHLIHVTSLKMRLPYVQSAGHTSPCTSSVPLPQVAMAAMGTYVWFELWPSCHLHLCRGISPQGPSSGQILFGQSSDTSVLTRVWVACAGMQFCCVRALAVLRQYMCSAMAWRGCLLAGGCASPVRRAAPHRLSPAPSAPAWVACCDRCDWPHAPRPHATMHLVGSEIEGGPVF